MTNSNRIMMANKGIRKMRFLIAASLALLAVNTFAAAPSCPDTQVAGLPCTDYPSYALTDSVPQPTGSCKLKGKVITVTGGNTVRHCISDSNNACTSISGNANWVTIGSCTVPVVDTDTDGVPDSSDNCPTTSNADQLNTDADAQGDVCDTDDDGDGVADASDNCPLSVGLGSSQTNTDGDAQGDVCDTDDDGDGVTDASDNCPLSFGLSSSQTNTDGDAQGNVCDTDDDGDGVADASDNCPLGFGLSSSQTNTDGDSQGDVCDADDDGDGVIDTADNCSLVANATQLNSDGDAQGNACDTDDDNDGVADTSDNCSLLANVDQLNTDGDALGNLCDGDDDGDGKADTSDNCPLVPNPAQTDLDGDGKGDACDDDADGDGYANASDLCPLGAVGTGNLDADKDGCADAEDTDLDNDGVLNADDKCPTGQSPLITDLDNDGCDDIIDSADMDGDGVPDSKDFCMTSPFDLHPWQDRDGDGCNDNKEDADADGDGIKDGADQCISSTSAIGDNSGLVLGSSGLGVSNPNLDKDGDGCLNTEDDDIDGDGHLNGSDNCPNGLTSGVDTNNDGCFDAEDPAFDSDGDGIPNMSDNCPTVSNSTQTNTDGDLLGNACDTDDDGDGILDGSDNCSLVSNPDQLNTDGDAQGNVCDSDDDNDGRSDTTDNCPLSVGLSSSQTDSDSDGQGNVCDADDDNDGVADGSDNCKTSFGLPATQINTDGDSLGDLCDTDDDNDGVTDIGDNCPLSVGKSNSQIDSDNDGQGDVCDTDDDNDGVPDTTDNCRTVSNAGQADYEGDTLGDACDTDDDNDDIPDSSDYCSKGSKGDFIDKDNDGCEDNVEDNDPDGDGVVGATDKCTSESSVIGTGGPLGQPANSDTDGDGCDISEDFDTILTGGTYTLFQAFSAYLGAVMDDNSGLYLGLSVPNIDNGGTILKGYKYLVDNDTNGHKDEIVNTLARIPVSQGALSHKMQISETLLEVVHYLNGSSDLYNAPPAVGTTPYVGNSVLLGQNTTGNFGAAGEPTAAVPPLPDFDRNIIRAGTDTDGWLNDTVVGKYNSPFSGRPVDECSKLFGLVMLSNSSQWDDDLDAQIAAHPQMNASAAGKLEDMLKYLSNENTDLVNNQLALGKQNMPIWIATQSSANSIKTLAQAGGKGDPINLMDPDFENKLRDIFAEVLSTSSSFVAASVPVNVYNRTQVLDDFFLAVFEAEHNERWPGNIKKLSLANPTGQGFEIFDTVNLVEALAGGTYETAFDDQDGRIKYNQLTFWTEGSLLPPPTPPSEKLGKDGRSVARGGAGQKIPQFLSGTMNYTNSTTSRRIYTENAADDALVDFDPTDANAVEFYPEFKIGQVGWPTLSTFVSKARISTALSIAEQQKAASKVVMHYARGVKIDDPFYDYKSTSGPVRDWIMGDIIHSKPLVINYGNIKEPGKTTGWDDPKNPYVSILVGANDGMLHIIENTAADGTETGKENFAYIPRELLKILPVLAINTGTFDNPNGTNKHPYGMDLELKQLVFDDTTATGNKRNTVDYATGDGIEDFVYVYAGMRRGGKSYYSLDVTNPFEKPIYRGKLTNAADDPEKDLRELGLSFSLPVTAQVKFDNNVTPVLIFAGGYSTDLDEPKPQKDDADIDGDGNINEYLDPDNAGRTDDTGYYDFTHGATPATEGNAIYMVNAITMELIWKATNDSMEIGSTNYHYPQPELNFSIPSTVEALDTNKNGYMDRIYVGDVAGNIWRGDFPECGSAAMPCDSDHRMDHWSLTKLASLGGTTAAGDTRFFHAPSVAFTKDTNGDYDGIVIGSGDRENPLETTDRNRVYMIKDRNTISGQPNTTPIELDNLPDVTDCVAATDAGCAALLTPPSSPPAATDTSIYYGWRYDLGTTPDSKGRPMTGEKMLSSPMIANGAVFATSYVPEVKIAGQCAPAEGVSYAHVLNLADGSAAYENDIRFIEISAGMAGDVTSAGSTIIFPGTIDKDFVMPGDQTGEGKTTTIKNLAEGQGYYYWRENDINDTK